MAGFLARPPSVGYLPAYPIGSGNKICRGSKDLQLRVQLRTRTGFPFTDYYRNR
ncbi:hypothetical protein M092_3865 [Parabacteroides distasonis str. 3776 D15 iv]|uniref:Uncharacterized protein n=1 Tax=Parabacteroides distasonis str. 3776 D15 i TaxID=1339342 RepID=A0AB34LHX2_PARDI|nr:hypothetical protein M091_4827 [Parabacteroides distasonis str. 3776 D15 i]KDS46950.1 hypothetical protein M090_3603 [Parabacteroides distasonis str. 3776 Po2 i]KDS69681.1 hypothetical protein M092_3865 [Parabacteroides distasonis str. 3776 D15 iv]